jgi:hypothetical protein
VLSWDWGVAFELLTFPVIRLEVETPKSSNVLVSFVIFSTKKIHRAIEDDCGVGMNVGK